MKIASTIVPAIPDAQKPRPSAPPGLERRGLALPPGIARRLEAGGEAPGGIAKRFALPTPPAAPAEDPTDATANPDAPGAQPSGVDIRA